MGDAATTAWRAAHSPEWNTHVSNASGGKSGGKAGHLLAILTARGQLGLVSRRQSTAASVHGCVSPLRRQSSSKASWPIGADAQGVAACSVLLRMLAVVRSVNW